MEYSNRTLHITTVKINISKADSSITHIDIIIRLMSPWQLLTL